MSILNWDILLQSYAKKIKMHKLNSNNEIKSIEYAIELNLWKKILLLRIVFSHSNKSTFDEKDCFFQSIMNIWNIYL